jgi:hypothetical protein
MRYLAPSSSSRWEALGHHVPVAARDREIIYESRKKAWLLVLGALAFVALGWFLIIVGADDSGWSLHRVAGPIGVVGIAFGALGVVFLLPRAIHRRPVLTLSEDGFIDGSMPGGNVFVPWTEVSELRLQQWGSVRFITGRVTEPERLQRQRNPLARALARANRPFGDIWIADSALPVSAELVIRGMRERWRTHHRADP